MVIRLRSQLLRLLIIAVSLPLIVTAGEDSRYSFAFMPPDLFFCPPPPDTICKGDTLYKGKSTSISASGGDSYLWSTGETTPAITITPLQNSLYSVTVSNTSGSVTCSKDTSLMQYVKSCNVIYFPNAISLSGTNNIFKPVGEDIYTEEYHLAIYNRWGQLIFMTTDFEEGWNGTFKGVIVPEGVYVYEVIINGGYGKPFRKQGTVTVVR